MLKIIDNNPFRTLGVYINSPSKMIIASKSKMIAFARVGKSVQCETDFPNLMSIPDRNLDSLNEADSKLNLLSDRVKYAQFWFIKTDTVDNVTFNYLSSNDYDKACQLWKKVKNAPSLQNLIVLSLIRDKMIDAFSFAEELYANYPTEFCKFLDANNTLSDIELFKRFCETIINENVISQGDWCKIIDSLKNISFKQCIQNIRIAPYVKLINDNIAMSASKMQNGQPLDAGYFLLDKTKEAAKQLSLMLDLDDAIYQITMDKLSSQITNYASEYYNNSSEYNRANKSIGLFEKALAFAVSGRQQQLCESNCQIVSDALVEDSELNFNSYPSISELTGDSMRDLLSPFVKFGDFFLGKTTLKDLEKLGCKVEREYDWYQNASYKGATCISSSSAKNELVDQITLSCYSCDNWIIKLNGLNSKDTYNNYIRTLRAMGFVINVVTEPQITGDSDKYFYAIFNAESIANNIKIQFDIFYKIDSRRKQVRPNSDLVSFNSVRVSFDPNRPCKFHNWFEDKSNEQDKKLNFFKNLVICKNFILGKTTVRELRALGCEIDNEKEYDWISSSINGHNVYDNGKTGTFDEIWYSSSDEEDIIYKVGLTGKKTCSEWIELFKEIGYNAKRKRQEDISKSDYGGYSVTSGISFKDISMNIELSFELYETINSKRNPSFVPVQIERITVQIIDQKKGAVFLSKLNDSTLEKETISKLKKTSPSNSKRESESNKRVMQVATSKQLRSMMLPVDRISLGKTTYKEAVSLGFFTEQTNGDSHIIISPDNREYKSEKCNQTIDYLRIPENGEIPGAWTKLGFDWNLSFDGWKNALEKIGFKTTIQMEPHEETNENNKKCLRAEILASSKEEDFEILLTFDYNERNRYCQSFTSHSPKTLKELVVRNK